MADDKVALEIFIEADKAQMSLGDLEAGFDSMKERLKEVGRGSEEFKELSTAMANTSKEIKNIELGFEGLDREQVASELGSVAGAVGDVTASLVLMGGESETMEQIGASIEKAMAISMGFKGAIEGLSSANKLYNNLLKQGKVALIAKTVVEKAAAAGTWLLNAANKALNITMKANPIGLIVTAITAVVGAIIYFKDEIWSLIKTALKPFQFAIDAVVDALQWLGIMESDSAIATRKAEEEKARAALESAEKRTEATEKLIEAHNKMTESIVADMDFEIRKRKANGEDTAEIEAEKLRVLIESAKKEQELQKQKLKDLDNEFKARVKAGKVGPASVSKLLKAKVETSKAIQKANEEQIASEQDLEIATIEAQNKIDDNAKKASDKRKAQREKDKAAAEKAAADQKKIDEKAAADAIQLEKDKNQLLEDLEAKAIEDKNVRALAELEIAQERERQQLIEKYGEDTELMLALEEEQMLQMNTLIEGIENEAKEKKIASDLADAELKQTAKDKELQDIKDIADAKQAQREKDFALATASIGALSALNKAATDTALLNAAGDEEKKEKIRKASFEREKKLNIAMAAINGAQAVLAGFAQGGLPMAIIAGVTAAAQLAAIVATTYQSGASPAEVETPTQEPRPDGAGGGGGGVQLSPVSNTSTILGGQQVFVTETDITETQNNVSVIEESATF